MDVDGRVHGYEYDYRFSMDVDVVIDDVDISDEEFRTCLSQGSNVYHFEIRTNFILKKRGVDVIRCSEDFRVRLGKVNFGKERELEVQLIDRLREYWMLDHEVKELVQKAIDFADRSGSTPRFVPVVVEIDVCTVQRDGEGVDEAFNRAIRVENLVPLRFLDVGGDDSGSRVCEDKQLYLISYMPRARVKDASEGSAMMEACPICLLEPRTGDQISVLRRCRHAFHYHCIVTWLVKNNACPLCRCRVRQKKTCDCDSCCD